MKPRHRRRAQGPARKPSSGGLPLVESPAASVEGGGWPAGPDDPALDLVRDPAADPAERFEPDQNVRRGNEERPTPEPFEL